MNLLILSALYLPVGWIATLIMERDLRNVRARTFLIATAGAALGGGWLAPLLRAPTIAEYGLSLPGAFISLLAAIALLAVVDCARRAIAKLGRALGHKMRAADSPATASDPK
jgi:uncharacterized membrane protein YeaQ/YmgE (transglycosylase-associated protein family)